MNKTLSPDSLITFNDEAHAALQCFINRDLQNPVLLTLVNRFFDPKKIDTLDERDAMYIGKKKKIDDTLFQAHVEMYRALNDVDHYLTDLKNNSCISIHMLPVINPAINDTLDQIDRYAEQIDYVRNNNNNLEKGKKSLFIEALHQSHYCDYTYEPLIKDNATPKEHSTLLLEYCSRVNMLSGTIAEARMFGVRLTLAYVHAYAETEDMPALGIDPKEWKNASPDLRFQTLAAHANADFVLIIPALKYARQIMTRIIEVNSACFSAHAHQMPFGQPLRRAP